MNMTVPHYFISCDWGTTNFRLRLVATETLEVLWENQSDQGVKKRFEAFNAQTEFDQKNFYLNYLFKEVQKIPEEHRNHTIVSSGMSSSNIGLYELPYTNLPFDKNGNTFFRKSFTFGEKQTILLISGIRSETGMMRGEEVQAIGLEEYLEPYAEGVLLLPGTHSKHISYRQGSFYALKNFMTGELFEVLGTNSILANSIEAGKWNYECRKAFLKGFNLGIKGAMTSSLLQVRARQVIEKKSKKGNYYMLSGLLIGDELSYLRDTDENVFLAAPGTIFELYRTGLEKLKAPEKLMLLNGSILERALLNGQKKILLSHAKH